MPEVKYGGPGPEKRIADRLRPSNEHSSADHHTSHGTGPTRTVTTIDHSKLAVRCRRLIRGWE